MARYYGMIGFGTTKETSPGIDTVEIIEKPYYGDVLDDSRRWESSEQLNDDFNIMNKISIVADTFATQNLQAMRYATFLGVKWKIKSAYINYPRITLSLGGEYNG